MSKNKRIFIEKLGGTYVNWGKFLGELKHHIYGENMLTTPTVLKLSLPEIKAQSRNPRDACLLIMYGLIRYYPHSYRRSATRVLYASMAGVIAEQVGSSYLTRKNGNCPKYFDDIVEALGKEDICPILISKEYNKFQGIEILNDAK